MSGGPPHLCFCRGLDLAKNIERSLSAVNEMPGYSRFKGLILPSGDWIESNIWQNKEFDAIVSLGAYKPALLQSLSKGLFHFRILKRLRNWTLTSPGFIRPKGRWSQWNRWQTETYFLASCQVWSYQNVGLRSIPFPYLFVQNYSWKKLVEEQRGRIF